MESYSFGVRWIADNDEPDGTDPEIVAGYVSTLLLADLFGKQPGTVALDIVDVRQGRPMSSEDKTRAAEKHAWEAGYEHGLHGGLRTNPYRTGKVFGAALHRSWDHGFDAGRRGLRMHAGTLA